MGSYILNYDQNIRLATNQTRQEKMWREKVNVRISWSLLRTQQRWPHSEVSKTEDLVYFISGRKKELDLWKLCDCAQRAAHHYVRVDWSRIFQVGCKDEGDLSTIRDKNRFAWHCERKHHARQKTTQILWEVRQLLQRLHKTVYWESE